MFIGLIGAMEEVDNTTAEVDLEAAGETAVAVADESAEIQKDNTAIDVTVGQVEEAVQAGDELESIGEVAVDSVESGEGMTEQTAELAEIAIESICNRLSYRPAVRLVPAVESSFGNNASRLTSTKIIIENIGDTLKKIWASIKAAALRVWDMVKGFIANLFKSTTALGKHIDSLRQRVRNVDPSAKPEKKTLKSGVAKFFTIDKKANLKTWEDLDNNLLHLVNGLSDISAGRRKIAEEASKLFSGGDINKDSVSAYFTAQSAASQKIEDIVAKITQLAVVDIATDGTSARNQTANMKAVASKKSVKEFTYGPFPGHIVLSMRKTTTTVNGVDVDNVSLSFKAAKGDYAEEIEALDADGIKRILDQANKDLNTLKDVNKTMGNYETMTKSIVKSAETVISETSKILAKTGSDSETRQALEELKRDVKNSIADLGAFGAKAPAMVFQSVKHLADWASISLRNLKVK